jgi:energy-coupling factor transporter transmembrane protein EcfT
MSQFDVAIIDYWSASGRSVLHRAGPAAKVLMAVGFVAAVVITRHIALLAAVYCACVALLVVARVPAPKVMAIASYPAFFALLFVISEWDGTWQTPALVFGRALAAALTLVTLLVTTPYPRVFALLSRVLPRIVGEALFLTYRSLFLLLEMAANLVTATRVRSGLQLRHPLVDLRNLSLAMGKLLIHAFDRSELQYDIMVVRGYSGHIAAPGRAWNAFATDVVPVILGAAALAAAIVLRWIR